MNSYADPFGLQCTNALDRSPGESVRKLIAGGLLPVLSKPFYFSILNLRESLATRPMTGTAFLSR